ncbi:hypothetical protein KA089_02240 [Candidatus Woesebacteria bacterium]|nr:hypothetical protein [Candidatus Woesebacteria bacterium]
MILGFGGPVKSKQNGEGGSVTFINKDTGSVTTVSSVELNAQGDQSKEAGKRVKEVAKQIKAEVADSKEEGHTITVEDALQKLKEEPSRLSRR